MKKRLTAALLNQRFLRLQHLAVSVILIFCTSLKSFAQNPASVFTIPLREISLPCGQSCTTIKASVPYIKGSSDYVVSSIPYIPFSYAAGGTELVSTYVDDKFSEKISLPFPFCFFGAEYSDLSVGTNGIVTFDITNVAKINSFALATNGGFNGTPIPIPYAGGTQNRQGQNYYPKASIMGPYHDINPKVDDGKRRIEWRIEGTAPKRRFIASYNAVPLFSCSSLTATHQIVIYENTGVIEVYIKDKPVCTGWDGGLAILGIQNFNRDKAVAAPGKNATVWGKIDMNEAYRFTPYNGASLFKKAELLLNNNVIAVSDTTVGADGLLDLSFPNVCLATDSATYTMRVTYGSCSNAATEVTFDDSIVLKKSNPAFEVIAQNATCTSSGNITISAPQNTAGYVYSLNNGPTQASNNFSNLAAGNYTITASNNNCTITKQATIVLDNNLYVKTVKDTSICSGSSFPALTTTNAATLSWQPAIGVSNPAEESPVITAPASATYVVTATEGLCKAMDTLNVVVRPIPQVTAGENVSIIEGETVQLTATASTGNVVWSPATGLSAINIINPVARPVTTSTYVFSATNAEGCTASDDVTITVLPYCFKPMEAFTPNGDGINDVWKITTGNCGNAAKVQVLNRYGNIVFESANYNNSWDGKFNGKPLPDGTYYFIISYTWSNGRTIYKKGSVTILR